jgi:hypothetical protein
MTEERVLNAMNQHGVDFMLAGVTQQLSVDGIGAIVVHLFIEDSRENRVELTFALRELGGVLEIDGPVTHAIPNDPDWLLLSPAHCVRCPQATLFVFRSFPGLEEPFAEIKKRAELIMSPNGEMHYCMSVEDKRRFIKAFEDGHSQN